MDYYIWHTFFISNHVVINDCYYLLLLYQNIRLKQKEIIKQKIESKSELKETDMKYHICYYLNEIININDLDLNSILLDQISWESIQFMILYTKLHMMQNIYVLFLLN